MGGGAGGRVAGTRDVEGVHGSVFPLFSRFFVLSPTFSVFFFCRCPSPPFVSFDGKERRVGPPGPRVGSWAKRCAPVSRGPNASAPFWHSSHANRVIRCVHGACLERALWWRLSRIIWLVGQWVQVKCESSLRPTLYRYGPLSPLSFLKWPSRDPGWWGSLVPVSAFPAFCCRV